MKLNEQIFNELSKEPMEVQKFGNKILEIHRLEDYEGLYNKLIHQYRNFSMWSYINSDNYKLVVEEGYYETLKPLFQKKVNEKWIDHWVASSLNQSRVHMLLKFFPAIFPAIIIISIISMFMIPPAISSIISVMLLLFTITFLFFSNYQYKKKSAELHTQVVNSIKTIVGGEEKFNILSNRNTKYTESFFKKYNEASSDENNGE